MTLLTVIAAPVAFALSLASAARLSGAWKRAGFPPCERFLAGGVLWAALLLGSFHLLGFVHLVTGWRVVTIPAVALLQALALAIVLAGTARLRGGATAHAPEASPRPAAGRPGPARRLVLAALSILAPGYIVGWAAGLSRPPVGPDVLWYHLPLAANWLHTRSLAIEGIIPRPDPAMDLPYAILPFSYPANGSVLAMLPLAARAEFLVPFLQLPALLLACAALYAIGRRLGMSPSASLLASCGFAATPMVILQTAVAQADLLAAAFVLTALAFGIAAMQAGPGTGRSRPPAVLAAGLAAGTAAGMKLNGLMAACVLAALLTLFLGARLIRESGLSSGLRRGAGLALVFVLAWSAAGSFWYIRSAACFGTPVFPFGVRTTGATIVQQEPAHAPLPRHRAAVEAEAAAINPWLVKKDFSYKRGLGALFSTLVPLGAAAGLLAAAAALVRRSRRIPPAAAVVVGFVVVDVALWKLLSSALPRHILAELALACLLAGLLVDLAGRVAGHPRDGDRTRRSVPLPVALAAGAVLACSLANSIAVAVVSFTTSNPDTAFGPQVSRNSFYGVPGEIDSLPPGSLILNDLDSVVNPGFYNYPLYGRRLLNRVSDEVDPAAATPAELHTSLRRRGIQYVFIHYRGDPPARYDDPALFRVVADTGFAGRFPYGFLELRPRDRPLTRARLYDVLPGERGGRP